MVATGPLLYPSHFLMLPTTAGRIRPLQMKLLSHGAH
jgi:hypothetical protein